MGKKYILDANAVIDYVGNKLPSISALAMDKLVNDQLNTSIATQQQLSPLTAFMETTILLPIDESVIEKTISIRQTTKVGLGDAIIAATALQHNLKLITHNTADFKNIEGLQLIDPYEV
jgi:predicted nucleic acid-binding protein